MMHIDRMRMYEDKLTRFFESRHAEYDAQANYEIVLEACPAPVNLDTLEIAFRQVRSRLAISADTQEELDKFYALGLVKNIASTQVLLNHYQGVPDLEAFKDVLKRYPESFTLSPAYRAEQHREALLAEISAGKDSYWLWQKSHGKAVEFQIADLRPEATTFIEDIHAQVRAYRATRTSDYKSQNPRSHAPQDITEEKDWAAIQITEGTNRKPSKTVSKEFPPLPKQWRGIELTTENMRRIDAETFRYLTRIYGEQQCIAKFQGAN